MFKPFDRHLTTLVSATLLWSALSPAAADPPVGAFQWRDATLAAASAPAADGAGPVLQLIRQDCERLELGRSTIRTPLRIGDRSFASGLGSHSVAHLKVVSDTPITAFSAWVGLDVNERTTGGPGSVVFVVKADGRERHRTGVLRAGDPPHRIELALEDVRELDLHVEDGGDGVICDHADWAEARITTRDGSVRPLETLMQVTPGLERQPWGFSFVCQDRPSRLLLDRWPCAVTREDADEHRDVELRTWTDPDSGLRVTCRTVRFRDFPAAEWLLSFENTGTADTPIIENVQACDLLLNAPRDAQAPYLVYRTRGGTPDAAHFEARTEEIDMKRPRTLSAGSGRSSTADFPFFKIDAGRGSIVVAVGWSGCWKAEAVSPDNRHLRLTAGLEQTRFRLKPGESVRSPRMLVLFWDGDTWEANARFRELIAAHYAARRDGKPMPPMLFCNTCFTRGGGWLNECNAANQISLIKAYAPLGLEALITDAGWFRGGWPEGAGNWTPREDAYPQGMGPVARAALDHGMIYGLWFEPERVVSGTDLHRTHPEWLLSAHAGEHGAYLLNFGLKEVQDYFFQIVADFMKLPGFRFYRQDFNIEPLPYWRYSDAPDRQGITEMKYIEGLYAWWDRMAATWPDSVREECASGGHRIDLETVMRMHLHQKTDYWFNDDVDQASLWGLSQYLPNGIVVAHLNRLDDYSFHSTMASSLCLGWIADAPDFDRARGQTLARRYLAVRHLLTGAWYPLLPYSRDRGMWTGSQFYRADLDEGLLLVFRRADCPYPAAEVQLRGLHPNGNYELVSDAAGPLGTFSGRELMQKLTLRLDRRPASDLIVYRRR